MKSQNITIVLLLVTAALLTGILVSTFVGTSQPATASGNPVRGGDYIMCTAAFSGNIDNLWVIDAVAKKMTVYVFNPQSRPPEIDLIKGGGVDLEREFPAKK
jgi:hypothetical protein